MAEYYYPVLDSNKRTQVDLAAGKVSMSLASINIEPKAKWIELKKAVKIDESALNNAITATGVTDAGFILFLKQLVTLPLTQRKNILTVIDKIRSGNASDNDRIEQGNVLVEQVFGVGSYVLESSSADKKTPILINQESSAIDLKRNYKKVVGSTFFLPGITTDRKKFRLDKIEGSYKTYYDRVSLIPVVKSDYDDFFSQLESKYRSDSKMLQVIEEFKELLMVSIPGNLPDTKQINSYMRLFFAPTAFEERKAKSSSEEGRTKVGDTKKGEEEGGTGTESGSVKKGDKIGKEELDSLSYWGRKGKTKKSFGRRVVGFFGAHWLGTLISAVAVAGITIGVLVLTAPASVMGLVSVFATLGAKMALSPQISVFIALFGAGVLASLSRVLFKNHKQRRRNEIKAWRKRKKIVKQLTGDNSLIKNRVFRLQNTASPMATTKHISTNVNKIKSALSKSERNLNKMISRLKKEKARRVKINTANHMKGMPLEDTLNGAEVIRENTLEMNKTLVDNIDRLKVLKTQLQEKGKNLKAAKIQTAIDKMKTLNKKVCAENKKVYNNINPEESESVKTPVDVLAEDARRNPSKYSSEVIEVLRKVKGTKK